MSRSSDLMPRKQQWALIYEHQRRQFERRQQQQKDKQRMRKLAFKEALDQHVINKRSMSSNEKLQNAKYYYSLHEQSKRDEQKERIKMLEEMKRRKEVEERNLQITEQKNKRPKDMFQNKYSIGVQDVQQIRRKNQLNKKLFHKQLEYQQHQKNQLKEAQRIKQIQKQMANKAYELQKQEQKLNELARIEKYRQNMDIFNKYEKLKQDKLTKQKEFQRKRIYLPAQQQQIIQKERQEKQYFQRVIRTQSMKDSLLQQIQTHNKAKANKDNIEFYKDKRPKFDKQEYLKTLAQQQAAQKARKNSYKYMTQQEYKLNMGYLNKAVNGYSMPMKNDRSAFSIGNPQQISKRKDDIYFNKLNHREKYSASVQKRTQESSNSNLKARSQLNSQQLQFIKDKISRIMINKQRQNEMKNRQKQKAW